MDIITPVLPRKTVVPPVVEIPLFAQLAVILAKQSATDIQDQAITPASGTSPTATSKKLSQYAKLICHEKTAQACTTSR